jgi:hypothetical protein
MAAAPGRSASVVPLSIVAAEPSGVRVYDVENPAGLGLVLYWVNSTWTGDYTPWHIQLIQPDGAVTPFLNLKGVTSDGDFANWGQGDGVAYAGASSTTVQSPAVLEERTPNEVAWSDPLPGTSGRLVIAWANQVEPITFEVHFPPATRVVLLASAPLSAYEMKDLGDGARVGVPTAAIASIGNGLKSDPEGEHLWGYVFYMKSTAFGKGKLTFERAGTGWSRELSLDAAPDSTSRNLCICFDWGRWVFTSGSAVEIGFDYVGDGGRTAVFVVLATLPAGTLPEDVWQEFDLTPPR